MTEQQSNGDLRITLKDVYQGQQAIERTVSDSFNELKVTLIRIQTHMDNVDQRNRAADELHAEHDTRLEKLEHMAAQHNLEGVRNDYGPRIKFLEDEVKSRQAVEEARLKSAESRVRAWRVVSIVAGVAVAIVTVMAFLLSLHHH